MYVCVYGMVGFFGSYVCIRWVGVWRFLWSGKIRGGNGVSSVCIYSYFWNYLWELDNHQVVHNCVEIFLTIYVILRKKLLLR